MASKISVTHTDDIDGSRAAETVAFSLDGAHYEIDLSTRNAKALRKAVAEFVTASRQVNNTPTSPRPRPTPRPGSDNAHIRAWAEANGIDVAAKGRIPDAVRHQHDTAQST